MLVGDRLKEVRADDVAHDPTEGLLAKIREPADLRQVPRVRLQDVCDELRSELIELGAVRGGHFAGSLGTVELTVGLHWVFDTPRDRLIWDVGHQAYGHKALTGRRRQLADIKRAEGPSGFLRRSESRYDVFGAGHAGTSISAALGIAEAQRRSNDGGLSVAVIGDGAATAGMAFEALNHAGELGANLKVVFNDNGMSIAPSVGGLHKTGRARAYFESLGFGFIGPVDGHDLDALVPALEQLRSATGPTVLHVITQKGHGFAPAAADPYRWHATRPFDPETGSRTVPKSVGPPSWTEAFSEALSRLADSDPRVVAITAAMPDGTGLDHFAKRHPGRVYDVGIAEQHAVTFAAGLATEGLRPVCAIYSTFLQRGFDQVFQEVALQHLPVVFCLDRAGLVGQDGPTHNGVFDIAFLRALPGMTLCAPRDASDMDRMLQMALAWDGPVALRFPRGNCPGDECIHVSERRPMEVGKAELLKEGDGLVIWAYGALVSQALEVADRFGRRGVAIGVVDARFAKPLDEDLVRRLAAGHEVLITVEEGAVGGFASYVLQYLALAGLLDGGLKIRPLTLPDFFIDHDKPDRQIEIAGLDTTHIVAAALQALGQDDVVSPAVPA